MSRAAAEEAVRALYHLPGFYEPFSSISHLLGAAAFAVLGARLVWRGRVSAGRVAFLAVYALACVFLLAVSGAYHMTTLGGAARPVMMRLDHGAIFVLIAGTFTPIHGLLFRGPLRWGPLLLIWSAAAAGIVVKTLYFDAVAEWLGLTFYLALGWLGLASGALLWRRYGFAFVRPVLWGGVAYSLGAALDLARWPVVIPGVVGAHEVFHLAVLAGALFHYAFIWQITGMQNAE